MSYFIHSMAHLFRLSFLITSRGVSYPLICMSEVKQDYLGNVKRKKSAKICNKAVLPSKHLVIGANSALKSKLHSSRQSGQQRHGCSAFTSQKSSALELITLYMSEIDLSCECKRRSHMLHCNHLRKKITCGISTLLQYSIFSHFYPSFPLLFFHFFCFATGK